MVLVAVQMSSHGDGVTVAVAEAEGVGVGEGDGVGLGLGDCVGVGDGDGVVLGVGDRDGVGVGLGEGDAATAQYLPPVSNSTPPPTPPQTIIWVPVHTATCRDRAVGASVVLVAVQLSVVGLYLPPVLK